MESSLPSSQHPTIFPYSEPHKSSFSKNQSNIILLFILTFSTKSVHTFLSHINLHLYEISKFIGFYIRFSLINFVFQTVRVCLSSSDVLFYLFRI